MRMQKSTAKSVINFKTCSSIVDVSLARVPLNALIKKDSIKTKTLIETRNVLDKYASFTKDRLSAFPMISARLNSDTHKNASTRDYFFICLQEMVATDKFQYFTDVGFDTALHTKKKVLMNTRVSRKCTLP